MRPTEGHTQSRLLASGQRTLPPELQSASAARELVRRALAEAGRERWQDQAELAVTEVVSNAVLHAHTQMVVVVTVHTDQVHVEVRDENPLLPAPRSYDERATTGRGLGLVALLTNDHGVTVLGGGKSVWFTITDTPTGTWETLEEAWDLGGSPTTQSESRGVDVVLQGLPVALWLAAQQHHDTLIREYTLHQAGESTRTSRTVNAADTAETILVAAVGKALDDAAAAGIPTQALPEGHPSPLPAVPARLDVELTLTSETAEKFTALQDTLDAAEELAQGGELLSRPALPEIVAVRDWCCEQVIAQLGGVTPTPWEGHDSADDDSDYAGTWDAKCVTESSEGVVAADDSNRIVAVSQPLADLLGWDVADLVGRRVVVLIPHRLREMHVAGFTRHLTTGESHVIGVPLELPVLKSDGNEISCHFMIERATGTGNRTVYLAHISPVEQDD